MLLTEAPVPGDGTCKKIRPSPHIEKILFTFIRTADECGVLSRTPLIIRTADQKILRAERTMVRKDENGVVVFELHWCEVRGRYVIATLLDLDRNSRA
jgi:hypothetical protein